MLTLGSAHQHTYLFFSFSATDHHNANHVFLFILIFKVQHSKAGGETKAQTNPRLFCELLLI